MLETKFLTNTDFRIIHEAFLKAFSDYVVPMKLSEAQLLEMFTRRGGELSVSTGAFEEGQLVAFALNGLGNYQGSRCIYDLGSGTNPDFRRKGLGETLLRLSISGAKERGVEQYVLEVIESNTGAFSMYQKVGFKVARRYEVFRGRSAKNDISVPRFRLQEIEPDWNRFQTFWDWEPSWQNSISSMLRSKAPRNILGVFSDSQLIGYGIVFPDSGDVPQFSIHHDFRRQGAATSLFQALENQIDSEKQLRMINVDDSDQASVGLLLSLGYERFGSQFEMKLTIGS